MSSQSLKRKGPKGNESEEGQIPKAGSRGNEAESEHLWNGCGSEAGKSERKRTAKLSTETGKERMGNQAGENGGSRGSESESGSTEEATAGRSQEERERKRRG